MNFRQLPESYLRRLLNPTNSPYIFLETLCLDEENKTSFLFNNFIDILTFNYGDNVDIFFKKVENYLNRGYWLAGYFNYEFSYFLEPALYHLQQKSNNYLAWLGVSRSPKIISQQRSNYFCKDKDTEISILPNLNYEIKNLHSNISLSEYNLQIQKIKYYLEEGLTYQVNFTFKVKFDFEGEVFDCYLNLRRAQPSSYAAIINTGRSNIISLSPELFFRLQGQHILARPMKGTNQRGRTFNEDKYLKRKLARSKKIKAENIMIVDLLRNDLGRIAERVWVSKLFTIEKYRTLYQMTSTIEAGLKSNLKLKDIFSSLFPCGSVTGAPKIRTMQIIAELEKEPRGIYTGAIGYISPQRKACFNVAIRTIYLQGNKGELGIGGGIVYDSVDKDEYSEAMLKAQFFIKEFPNLSLIESILLNKGDYFLLNLHLKRIKKSCQYFCIPLNMSRLKAELKKISTQNKGKFKLRLLVGLDGAFQTKREPLNEVESPARVKLSLQRTNPKDCFLYHKTTQRSLYDSERERAKSEGFFEVIFLNIYGELTEGSITNLFILKDRQLYTPPLKCGLLPGVLRESLLNSGRAKEKVLYPKDLFEADKIYIGNSVRGLIEAKIVFAKQKNLKVVEEAKVSGRMNST